jgi:hypothetical protein
LTKFEFIIAVWLTGWLTVPFPSHHAFGDNGSSSPEFECTAIDILNRARISELLGGGKYPSISLRKLLSGNFQLSLNGIKKIKGADVTIRLNHIVPGAKYEIKIDKSALTIDLNGIPPSRQGKLSEQRGPMSKTDLLAKLTCH